MTPTQNNAAADPVRPGSRVRHKKRGTVYEVIGKGRVQTDTLLTDMAEVVMYRGADGDLWARSREEFEDGRFEALSPHLAGGGEVEAVRPDAYQHLVDGKWVECSEFVAKGWSNELSPGVRALYTHPAPAKAALGAGVKVKPLEWGKYRNGDAEAVTPFGIVYTAYSGGHWRTNKEGRFIPAGDTVEQAKAAAQTDYERRVLSALTPEPPAYPEDSGLPDQVREPSEALSALKVMTDHFAPKPADTGAAGELVEAPAGDEGGLGWQTVVGAADRITELEAMVAALTARLQADDDKRMAQDRLTAIVNLEQENTALQAEIAAKDAALAPFALVAEYDIGESETDDDLFRPISAGNNHNRAPRLTVGHLRKARAALATQKPRAETEGGRADGS